MTNRPESFSGQSLQAHLCAPNKFATVVLHSE